MDLILSMETHVSATPDGRAWLKAEFDYASWGRYLEVFDSVTLLARAKSIPRPPDGWHEASGHRVRLHPIPDYTGPAGYIRQRRAVNQAIQDALSEPCAVIMRVPSQIATCAAAMLAGRPFGLEVVGDPADVFTYRALRKPLAFGYRWWYVHNQRRQCLRAAGVAYVTRHTLQHRYPARQLSFGVSDVQLPDCAFRPASRRYAPFSTAGKECPAAKLIIVGSLARPHKGVDVLIDAVAACRRSGLILQATIVGDGACRPMLESQVVRRGLADQISFAGQIAFGDGVRRLLDCADLFVLPSCHEGLPRAMVEAMARGLPCIGSNVGGIPEILPPEDMVPPGSVDALAEKIQAVVKDPLRLQAMSERNLRTAMEFRSSILADYHRTFYRHMRAQTEAWLRGRAGQASEMHEEETAVCDHAW